MSSDWTIPDGDAYPGVWNITAATASSASVTGGTVLSVPPTNQSEPGWHTPSTPIVHVSAHHGTHVDVYPTQHMGTVLEVVVICTAGLAILAWRAVRLRLRPVARSP
jgi:hypothetical protein